MSKFSPFAAITVATTLAANVALATGHSAAGPHFTATCNEHGAKLNVENKLTIYLGKSCDAHIVGQGDGQWFNAAESFTVDAAGVFINFGTRAVPCGLAACTRK